MPKRTNDFQELITTIYEQITPDNGKVTESGMVYDKDAKTLREADILIEYRFAHHDFKMMIECRDRSRKDSVEWIDGLIGKSKSLDVNKVVAVSKKGFTNSAIKKANNHGIDTLSTDEAVETDWEDYPFKPAISLFTDEKCQLVDVLYKVGEEYRSIIELGLDSIVYKDGIKLTTIKETFEYFLEKHFKPQIQDKVNKEALRIFKTKGDLSKTLYAESGFKFDGLKVKLDSGDEVDISQVKIIVNSTRKIYDVKPNHFKFNELMVSTGKHLDSDGSLLKLNVVQDAESKKMHVKWKREGASNKNYYIQLRDKYHPKNLKFIFLLESPPASGKYFYDEKGNTTEPLFSAIMELLNYKPTDKKDGLKIFMSKGFLLVDATYKQVNKLKGKERDNTILSDYNILVSDLENFCPVKNTPIMLVKANICRMLDEKLTTEGFNIINKGVVIPFPSHGQQKRFHKKASNLLSSLNNF
jgi:hypothetical protein